MKNLSLILCVVVSSVFAQETPADRSAIEEPLKTIAVIPLQGQGISDHESSILTERLRSSLVKDGRYDVVERSQMEEIMREQGFQQTGCISEECLIQAGLLLGAMEMVSGTVGKIGERYAVDIRLFDVETARIVKAVTRDHHGTIDGLLDFMEEIAAELAGERVEEQRVEETPRQEEVQEEPEAASSPPEMGMGHMGRTEIGHMGEYVSEAFEKFRETLSLDESESAGSLERRRLEWFPFQLSVVYPLQLVPSSTDIYGLRINVLYGKNENLYGFDQGFINEINDTLIGYQSGFYNSSGKVYGVQSGFLNTCDYLFGAQFGFINKANHLRGVQIGLLNYNPVSGGIPFMPIINIGF